MHKHIPGGRVIFATGFVPDINLVSITVDCNHIRVNKIGARVALKRGLLFLQFVRQPAVVPINQTGKLPADFR